MTHHMLQGTNLRIYFQKVAAHHGLEWAVAESAMAEDPGLNDETFYATNMREPVGGQVDASEKSLVILFGERC